MPAQSAFDLRVGDVGYMDDNTGGFVRLFSVNEHKENTGPLPPDFRSFPFRPDPEFLPSKGVLGGPFYGGWMQYRGEEGYFIQWVVSMYLVQPNLIAT